MHKDTRTYDLAWKYLNHFSLKINNQRYLQSPTAQRLVESFIDAFDERFIGHDFLWNYTSFQFKYWSDKKFSQRKVIELNWVIGKKARERWMSREENWQYFTQCFLNERKIVNSIKDKCEAVSVKSIESRERGRFLNHEIGFLHCKTEGIKYSNKDINCIKCIFKKKCRDEKE